MIISFSSAVASRAVAGPGLRTAATIAAVCLFVSGACAASGAVEPPASARPLSGVELYMLYHGKSWKWADGAGLFETGGRRFIAWSGTGDKAQWAEGRWIVTDIGRLCMSAEWHGSDGTFPNKTCFKTEADGETVYQRREPDGAWYVLRHPVAAEGDEYNKLTKDDLVSAEWQKIKSAMEAAGHGAAGQ